MGSGVIGAVHAVGLPSRSRQYPKGRVCSSPGCTTTLSAYNPKTTCALHTPASTPRLRGRKPRVW